MAPPFLALVSDSSALRHCAVASSDLFGISSRRGVQANAPHVGLAILRVTDLGWTRPVAGAYRKDACLSPAARRFIEILKAVAKEPAAK